MRLPRVFVYDEREVAAVAFHAFGDDKTAWSNYQLLLANGDVSSRLGVPRRVREPMYAEGLVHRHFRTSPRMVLTDNASDADMLWVPLWSYAACTALRTCRQLVGKDKWACRSNVAHLHQIVDSCDAMRNVYRWLERQDTWKRSHGADHVFFHTLKDLLWAESGNWTRSTRVLSNAVFATTEDRLPYPELRHGCNTAVMPYYANQSVWDDGLRFRQLVERKRDLLAFIGNSAGFSCHLLKGSWPPPVRRSRSLKFGGPMCVDHHANKVRQAVLRAVALSGGTARSLLRNSTRGHSDAPAALRAAIFCPHAPGDVYTSPRLYTAIMALCIPIIVSDRVQLPFTDAVDWSSFTLRLPERNLTRPGGEADLVQLARSVPPSRVATMQRALWQAKRLLTFHEDGPARDGRDALGLLTDELWRGVRCKRPVLVEQLGEAPCVHGYTFGSSQRHGLWVRGGCHGRFVSSSCLTRRGHARRCPALECGGSSSRGPTLEADGLAQETRLAVALCAGWQ